MSVEKEVEDTRRGHVVKGMFAVDRWRSPDFL
jgi:hypothetical protein